MKFKYINLFFILFIILAVSLTGCYKSPKNDSLGNIVKSKYDYPVKLYGETLYKAPSKIIVLSPSLLDIIHTLKYENCLVGKSDECKHDECLTDAQSVGSSSSLNIDKIKELSPELILSSFELGDDQTQKINELGIKLIVLPNAVDSTSLKKLYTNLGSLIAGANSGYTNALERAENILATVEDIHSLIPESEQLPTSCYMYDIYGSVITGDNFSDKLLSCVGTENIASNLTDGHMDIMGLYNKDPYYIFCAPGVKAQLQNHPTLSNLSAVKNNRVYEMQQYLLEYQGHTIIDAITYMTDCIYPNLIINDNPYSSNTSSQENIPQNLTSSTETSNIEVQSQTTPNQPTYTELKLGDTGDEVYKIQARLKELGHMYVDPDGIFDEMTQQGVINFQFLSDLDATGIANEKTLSILYSQDAVTGPDYSN